MMEEAFDWRAFLKEQGYYAAHIELAPPQEASLESLKEWLLFDRPRYTGWAPFWWPTRKEIEPQVVDQKTFECIHDGTGRTQHIERWRARIDGMFTIVRAYDSDMHAEPGKWLELTLPAWRVAELLLFSARMAKRFESPSIRFTVRYEGLSGRVISTRAAQTRILSGDYTTRAARYDKAIGVATEDVEAALPELTDSIVRGLFELFQFTLPATLCEQEIDRMTSGRF